MTTSKLQVDDLPLPGVKLIKAPFFRDSRGAFCQAFSEEGWRGTGISCSFVQDNFSESIRPGTVRGLHFQRGSSAQAKLVQVLKGAIFDVMVDIRPQSPTFGQHISIRLEPGADQLFVPAGYAHGFMTLMADTIVVYKVDRPYDPANEDGIYWADETLNINWPMDAKSVEISEKDRQLGSFIGLKG